MQDYRHPISDAKEAPSKQLYPLKKRDREAIPIVLIEATQVSHFLLIPKRSEAGPD